MTTTETLSGLRKVVAASMAGAVVEWYEFFLYGTAATLVFNKAFLSWGWRIGFRLSAVVVLVGY